MKIFVWTAVLIVATINYAYTQTRDTAIVSTVQQEIKLYPAWRSILSEESFPDYFKWDTLWQNTIQAEIQALVRQKLGVSQVIFPASQPVNFIVSSGALPPKSSLADAGDLLIHIHHTIGLLATAMDEAGIMMKNFNHTCRIQVKDRGNKMVFEGSATIPFRTKVKPGSGMYGMAEISAVDLKQLFEESLRAAFMYKSRKLPSRIYYRPSFTHPKYDLFLEKAELFSLQEFSPDVPLLKGQPQNNRYLFVPFNKPDQPIKLGLLRNYTGNVRSPEEMYTCRALLTNEFNQSEYQMWATLQSKNKMDGTAPVEEKPEVSVRCFSDNLQFGDFMLNTRKFEGLAGYTSFTIYQAMPKYTMELRLNNQLKAIIQKGGIGTIAHEKMQMYYVYLPKGASQEEKSELLTIFMIYKVAHEFGQDFL